jgi:hypothetical protein
LVNNTLYGHANDLLSAGDATTARGWINDHLGTGAWTSLPGINRNMSKASNRVNVVPGSGWGASNPVWQVQSWVFWNTPGYEMSSGFDVALNGTWLYVGFEESIWKSEDAGLSWFELNATVGAYDICVDPLAAGLIYFWTPDGDLNYISGLTLGSGMSKTETPLNKPLRIARNGNGGELYVSTGNNTLYKRYLGGWTELDAAANWACALRCYNNNKMVWMDAVEPHYTPDGATLLGKKGSWTSYSSPVRIHLLESIVTAIGEM